MADQPPADVNQEAKTAIAKRDEAKVQESLSLTKLVERRAADLYSDERAQEFASALISISEHTPKIKQCTSSSIMAAMTACIMLDLTPNTNQGFAYLIPYGTTVQFQLGYKGLMELAYRSGMVQSINAELVFEEDQFEFTLGTSRGITHKPDMSIDRTNIDKATHVYATATLMNGNTVFDVMSMSEIEKIRTTVKAKSTDAPWKTWPEQMAKKTVIKRMVKYLPQSRKDNRIHLGTVWDSWAEAGKLSYSDGQIIEGKTVSETVQPPKRQIKNFVKPPEQETETTPARPTEPPKKPEAIQEETITEDHDTSNDDDQLPIIDIQTDDSGDEDIRTDYITKINDMFDFIGTKARERMRIANEHGGTPILEKVKTEALKKIHDELKEVADAKTELLANKEEKPDEKSV